MTRIGSSSATLESPEFEHILRFILHLTQKRPKTKVQTHGLLHLDLVDFDTEELVSEVCVEVEAVPVLDVPPARSLVQDARLAACQRLQRAAQLAVLCEKSGRRRRHQLGGQKQPGLPVPPSTPLLGQEPPTTMSGEQSREALRVTYPSRRADLLHSELISLVEHQQYQRLEQ